MTTFAESLKAEISRIARKELKADVLALRKTSSSYRTEIASLKKHLKALTIQVKTLQRLSKADKEPPKAVAPVPRRNSKSSLGPASLIEFRKRIGISQVQLAQLIGASSLSVHKWETGKTRPRATQMQRISDVIKLGKRAAIARLAG